ncbi:hypothetical protein CIG19_09140 [Enterobacterales bacterium CwR94]|nr:hypothetical protein CIG19_09140 [Enterobacterales bacterium CwR94]
MRTFIINLPESISRRERMIKHCKEINIEPEFIEAILGRAFSIEEVKRKSRALTEVRTPGEFGCALSHISIYKKMVDEKISVALILEDDVSLNENARDVLDMIENKISSDEIILLNSAKQYLNRPIHKMNGYTTYPIIEADLTCSYVITLAAAESMLKFLYPVWLAADRWPFFRENNVAKISFINPPLSNLNELSSETTINGRDSEDYISENSIIWKKIRSQRPWFTKIKNILWKLVIKKYYKVIKLS